MRDAELAAIYRSSDSTIRRWRRAGVKSGVPAPLSNPAEMPAWWGRMMDLGEFEKGCPAAVMAAADGAGTNIPDAGAIDADLAKLLADISSGQVFGYSDGIKVAERNVQVTDFLLLRALKAGEERKVGPLQKRLNDAQDSLRTLLRDRAKIQGDAGETLPKSEVRAALLEIHGNITKRFRQGFRALLPDLAELQGDAPRWNTKVDEVVDSICRGMNETGFAAPE